jgi:hypothetical protein
MKSQQKPLTTKEFIIMVITGLVIWRVPLFFFQFGVMWSVLLPVVGFGIGYWVVMLLRKRGNKK